MIANDVADIARWVAATPLWQRYSVTADAFAQRLHDGISTHPAIYVAENENAVVGFIWLAERGVFNRSGYVQLIGVRPGERGRGVGRALMQFAEEKTFAQGRDLFLLTSDFNTAAQKFYERLGYQFVGKLDDYVIAGVSELIYWKRCKHKT